MTGKQPKKVRPTLNQLPEEITSNGFFPIIIAQLVRWMAAGLSPWTVSDAKLASALQAILHAYDPESPLKITVGCDMLRIVSVSSRISLLNKLTYSSRLDSDSVTLGVQS